MVLAALAGCCHGQSHRPDPIRSTPSILEHRGSEVCGGGSVRDTGYLLSDHGTQLVRDIACPLASEVTSPQSLSPNSFVAWSVRGGTVSSSETVIRRITFDASGGMTDEWEEYGRSIVCRTDLVLALLRRDAGDDPCVFCLFKPHGAKKPHWQRVVFAPRICFDIFDNCVRLAFLG